MTRARCAMFVDFDNVYSGLRRINQQAANLFCYQPGRWMQWLLRNGVNDELAPASVGAERQVLLRRCYLNPVAFGRYRAPFVRSAFEVIDCPPFTDGGKNSADIRMVMDGLDALSHPTRFDEFIILSGDADFTPLVLRLRAFDRRITVMTTGNAAVAYTAACDRVVTDEAFVEWALHDSGHVTTSTVPIRSSTKPPSGPLVASDDQPDGALRSTVAMNERTTVSSERIPSGQAAVTEDEVIREIVMIAHKAGRLIPLASLGHQLRDRFGMSIGRDWFGAGAFSKFLLRIPSGMVEIVPGEGGGSLRSLTVARQPGVGWSLNAAQTDEDLGVEHVIQNIRNITGCPALSASQYAAFFEILAERLSTQPYNITTASSAIRDELQRRGHPVSRANVSFILHGIVFGGYALDRSPMPHNVREIGESFRRNVRRLCANERMDLTVEEELIMDDVILGGLPPAFDTSAADDW